ncbi:MAG: peptidylprolyl isomerase, partial [Caldilineaceae bacterium]
AVPVQPAGNGAAAQLEPAARNGMYTAPPEMSIDTGKVYYATLKTDKGDIRVQLFADRAPLTVNNFVFLAREGFYDNTTFHRVLDGFMAQAGDPTGTGSGGPGYQFRDEFAPGLGFDRPNLLAMANSGPGTNGSQFFITFAPTDWLNNLHTIFGEVVSGQEVLDQITRRDPNTNPETPGDTLLTVEIEESDTSELPTPTPLPPTPTPFAPSSIAPSDLTDSDKPLAQLPVEERTGYFNSPPEIVIDADVIYTATIVTSKGEMAVKLYPDEALATVNNFVLLASLGFYDGTPVNEVTPGQTLIMGAPENAPSSDAGYFFSGEVGSTRAWAQGALAALPGQNPLTGELVSNSSQLLIALIAPPTEANAQLSFFGEVVEGIDVLNSLVAGDMIEEVRITTAP